MKKSLFGLNFTDLQLWQRILVIVLVCLLVAFAGWWLIFREESSLFFRTSTDTDNRVAEVPSTATPMLELTENLKVAKAILDQFTAHRSQEGFYGQSQTCNEADLTCQLNTYDYSVDPVTPKQLATATSHRENIVVAWARLKYWQQTQEAEQLELLKQDLRAVVKILDDPHRTLQTETFNCALLQDIYTALADETEIADLTKRLCTQADFEYHPESNISYDQHEHLLLSFVPPTATDAEIAQMDTVGVGNFLDITHLNEDFVTFESAQLSKQIQQNWVNLLSGQRQKYASKVLAVHQPKFMTRELMAALDQGIGSQFAQKLGEETFVQTSRLHQLILLEETLGWFNVDPSQFSSLDICLLKANLQFYLEQYPQVLTEAQKEQFAKILNAEQEALPHEITCRVAQRFAGGMINDSSDLRAKLVYDVQEPTKALPGYFYVSDGAIVYPVKINALLAGLLSL